MIGSSTAKQIFLDALDRPAPQRQAFVDDACDGDASLRERVLMLLESHEAEDGILDTSPALEVGVLDQLAHPMADARIGPYRLARVLGRGGHGIVWLAEQAEPIRRQVALKLLHPSLIGFGAHPTAARDVIARFEAERQALAVMDHPNVARVIDAGAVPSGPHAGQPYFAMEYVDGVPITQYCDDRSMDLDARLRLFVDVCAGVQHAHQKGLIHRDLKPGNVLVATVDGRPAPKVIDFGVAKAIGDLTPPSAITQQSSVIGTPQYMSPEQALLDGAPVDTRSDVYSLGAMLYELLVGSPPIAADTMHGLRMPEVCRLVLEASPPPPSARARSSARHAESARRRGVDPARLSQRLRGDLDWIVLKALAKEPDRRYPSAAELAADIGRHLRYEPIVAGPPSPAYRARKFVRRHRVGVAMSVAAGLLLVGATVVSLWMAQKARRAEAVALAQSEQTKRELAKFMAMAKFSQGILRGIDPAVARGKDNTLLMEVLASAARRADRDLTGEPEAAAAAHSMLGYAHGAIGQSARATDHYRRAAELSEQAFGPDHPSTLQETGNYFTALVDAERFADAEALAVKFAAALERTGRASSADALTFYSNFGSMYMRAGKPAEARPWLERAVRAIPSAREDPAWQRAAQAAQSNLAAAYFELNEPSRAKQMWERLLAEQAVLFGDDHPVTLATVQNLGHAAEKLNDPAGAEERFLQAARGKRKIYPPAHPSRLLGETALAEFYMSQRRAGEAVKVLEAADAECASQLSPDDPRRRQLTDLLDKARRAASTGG